MKELAIQALLRPAEPVLGVVGPVHRAQHWLSLGFWHSLAGLSTLCVRPCYLPSQRVIPVLPGVSKDLIDHAWGQGEAGKGASGPFCRIDSPLVFPQLGERALSVALVIT